MSIVAVPPNPPGTYAPGETAPPPVADHELLRVIGRGSYGEVWLARHRTLGTLRAVKVVRRADFDEERPFRREFDGLRRYEPISRGHPNLVAILHVGGDDAAFFCVMELADAAERQNEEGRRPKEDAEPTAASVSSFCTLPSTLSAYSPRTLRHELKTRGRLTRLGGLKGRRRRKVFICRRRF